jgi:hypothetical protein
VTLTEFLLARIGEDEAAAHQSEEYDRQHQPVNDAMDLNGWYDPARVLAECEAKRQIVAEHTIMTFRMIEEPGQPLVDKCDSCGQNPCPTLQLLALPYADDPAFDPEWKP